MCFCVEALIPKKLADDIDSHSDPDVCVNDAELACLSAILGTQSDDVSILPGQRGTIKLTNMAPLMSCEIHTMIAEKVLANDLDIFQQKLNVRTRLRWTVR